MHHTSFARGRLSALTSAAVLLLALCLLAGGAQAQADTPALVVSEPGLYTLDHDLAPDATVGVLINGSDVVFDGMGHTIAGTSANGSVGVLVSGRTTIDGVMGTNVTVRNVTVSGWDDGIHIAETSETVVERVVAEKNAVGLVITGTTGVTDHHVVRDSVFRNNTGTGAFRGNGMLLMYPAQGITVERCSITGNGVGITADEISHGGLNTLIDSVISDNAGDGVESHTGSFSLVRNCTVRANGVNGLEFEHGGAEIVGCHIEENSRAGIDAFDRGGSDIHGNWITGNTHGVFVGGDWPSHVRNNYLNNTDNGYFGAGENGLLNYEKTASANIVGGPYLGGNFWANPNGTGFSQTHPDADHDGICDQPYVVNAEENVSDNLPLAPSPGTPVVEPTPFKNHPVPGRIEAEDYDLGGEAVAYHDTTPGNTGGAYRHDDVDIEVGGSNYDVGWIRDGEFLIYTLNVPEAGFYDMTARVASPNNGRQMTISVNANPMNYLNVPNTGSFSTYVTTAAEDVYLPAGTVLLRLTFSGDGENLDWFAFAPQSPGTPGPTPTPTPTPYRALVIPGTIQAEDYDLGGEAVAYHDTTAGNEGGAYRHDDVDIETVGGVTDVGWIRNGEWLSYTTTVQSDAAVFTMTARVASPNSGRSIAVLLDGVVPLATIAVPNTGSFEVYRTVSAPVTLGTGTHTLRLTFQGDGQNLDWIAFTSGTVTTPTTTTPVPAGGASFTAAPLTAPHGTAVKFTVTPASGKSISAAWWSFDAPAHLNTWNSRTINPTFFYPSTGAFSPLVKITYTDGSTETVQRTGYIHAI